jgi:hypothetical protein
MDPDPEQRLEVPSKILKYNIPKDSLTEPTYIYNYSKITAKQHFQQFSASFHSHYILPKLKNRLNPIHFIRHSTQTSLV